MKTYLLVIFIMAIHPIVSLSKCYGQTERKFTKSYRSAKVLIKVQEYEKAKKILEKSISDKKISNEQLFYSKLLLAQVYTESRELFKSLETYNGISNDRSYNMTGEHVCKYLDLLRRNGLVSKAIEVTKRYHSELSSNDRFVNIESALTSYYQYYQNQKKNKYTDVSVLKPPDNLVNAYIYGIVPYGTDYLLLMNQYNYSNVKSFYINSKIVPLLKKTNSISKTTSFDDLTAFVQQGPATFFENNKKVIFTANQYNKYNTGNRPYGSTNKLQLYYSVLKKNNKWSRPKNISDAFIKKAVNYSFLCPSIDKDGKQLYFSSDMKGGFGGTDIYYCNYDKKREKWGTPINMGDQVNTNGDELFPFVKNDTLLFSSNGLVGFGDHDIFIKKISAIKESPIHLPYPINTQFKDTSPVFDLKSTTLFFSSDRNIQKTGYILDQIYSVVPNFQNLGIKQDPDTDPEKDNKTIKNNIEQEDIPNKQIKLSDKKNVILLRDTMDIIHFDLNKYVIKTDQYKRLDSIYSMFIKNRDKVLIAIDGHTDITGTEAHNVRLSEMRAKNVMNYLTKKGVPKNTFTVQWFGFSRPVVQCNQKLQKENKCGEVNTLNRRCEVYIKNKIK